MDSRTKAILTHITIIGWLVVLLLNNEKKDEMASFYLRQTLILHVLFMIVSWIPVVGWMVWIVAFALWVLSFVYAVKNEQKPIPFVGEYFQSWFAAL